MNGDSIIQEQLFLLTSQIERINKQSIEKSQSRHFLTLVKTLVIILPPIHPLFPPLSIITVKDNQPLLLSLFSFTMTESLPFRDQLQPSVPLLEFHIADITQSSRSSIVLRTCLMWFRCVNVNLHNRFRCWVLSHWLQIKTEVTVYPSVVRGFFELILWGVESSVATTSQLPGRTETCCVSTECRWGRYLPRPFFLHYFITNYILCWTYSVVCCGGTYW